MYLSLTYQPKAVRYFENTLKVLTEKYFSVNKSLIRNVTAWYSLFLNQPVF